MPRRDGTGPLGHGAGTGRALGGCCREVAPCGRKRGQGRGLRFGGAAYIPDRTLIDDHNVALLDRIDALEEEIRILKENKSDDKL